MDPIPISLVAHHIFCPRRAWLEAAGEQTDTHQMAAGVNAHRTVDDATRSRLGKLNAVDISSDRLGIVGRADVVEDAPDGMKVVEFKATPVRRVPEVTDAMRIQLALQGECLAEAGFEVAEHGIYFTSHQRFVAVEIIDSDKDAAVREVHRTRTTITATTAPAPLEDDPRCLRCSHVGVCLPEERAQAPVSRRISVADPDSQIVHLATAGSRASMNSGRLRVHHHGEELASIPLERVRGLVVHGNIDLSSALIRELHWRGLTIVWCSGRGSVIGWSHTARTPNGVVRVRQHQASTEGRIGLARAFIAAKVANQATLLRRNGNAPDAVAQLRTLQHIVESADTIGAIFGSEGDAAARYFIGFPSMLSTPRGDWFRDRWTGRMGRGALDPLNVALNYLYGVLLAEVIRAPSPLADSIRTQDSCTAATATNPP